MPYIFRFSPCNGNGVVALLSMETKLFKTCLFALTLFVLTACHSVSNKTSNSGTAAENSGDTSVLVLLDTKTFKDMSDEELESSIVDIADNQVSSNDSNPYAALEQLPFGYQVIYVTWRVESEVNSGGFYQYFHDTNAKFTFLAQRAFKLIAAPKTADLLSRAMLQVEEKMPALLDPDRHPQPFNEKEVENDPLKNLDNEFFDGDENLSELRVRYIRKHANEFNASTPTPTE